jgi:hypothetical protein
MKSDYQISAGSVYNTFPFPTLSVSQGKALKKAAEEILRIRENFPDISLGDLYDPITMPVELRKAHIVNDDLVLSIFGLKGNSKNSDILKTLFSMYLEMSEANLL